MPLDERSRRKSGFRPGIPIMLSDGSCWSIPVMRARVNYTPDATLEWLLGGIPDPTLGAQFDALLTATLDSKEEAREVAYLIKMAQLVMSVNYELTDEEGIALFGPAEFLEAGYPLGFETAIWVVKELCLKPVTSNLVNARAALPPSEGGQPRVGLN